MILDRLLQMAAAQAVTATDAYTDYSFDLGDSEVIRRIGNGRPLSVIFVVTTAGAGATDTTDFKVVQDTVAGMTNAPQTIAQTRVPNASLVKGYVVQLPLPANRPTLRYLAGRVELGTGDTVAVDCYLVPSEFVGEWIPYGAGYAV